MNEILDFIKRRFSENCHWLDRNCYYFSVILLSRFPTGIIFYDITNCHFIFRYEGSYYDWTGVVCPDGKLIEWDKFEQYDNLQKQVIIRDCIK